MASTKYADEGTCSHEVAAMCLTEGSDPAAYVGRLIELEDYKHAKLSPSNAHRWMACPGSHALEADVEFIERFYSVEFTEEMAEYTQVYVDAVRARVEEYKLAGAVEVNLFVERPLPIGQLTGEEDATGTGDAVIVAVWPNGTALLDVGDLKTGKGVEVEVEENEQLQIYALGALHELDLLYDFTRVRLTIYQPRIKREPSDWEVDVEVLRKFGKHVEARAYHALQIKENEQHDALIHHLTPGEKQCRFCKAKATCPKLRQEVAAIVFDTPDGTAADDFDDLTEATASVPHADTTDGWLAVCMDKVDMIEQWCTAVRAEVERRLLHGVEVPGYKLVQGKRGARAWSDTTEVEATFKSMRLKQEEMYEYKLISPTTAEKLLKDTPKRWTRVASLITQSEGKPHVAPMSDKRPALAIAPVEDDFDVVTDDLAG